MIEDLATDISSGEDPKADYTGKTARHDGLHGVSFDTINNMTQPDDYRDYPYILDVLASGGLEELTELEQLVEEFPYGVDDYIGRHWITNAIDCGSLAAIAWILSRGVDLTFRDKEGYTVLHSALDRGTDKYQVLELLLMHGAPVNPHGFNDWTPAHMAAAREDIEALKLLIRFGADLSIRTRIDDYATPLEEAQMLNKMHSVRFLEKLA